MPIAGVDYDNHIPIDVPSDVVQWRVVADPECVVEIHLARGDGSFEIRDILISALDGRDVYVPGHLIHVEKEGGDEVCIFIEKEWD